MTTTNSVLRADLNDLVLKISKLATEASSRLTNGSNVLDVATSLVKENASFIFKIGQLYQVEQASSTQTATTSSGSTVQVNVGSSRSNANYHNVRDSRGRFTRV